MWRTEGVRVVGKQCTGRKWTKTRTDGQTDTQDSGSNWTDLLKEFSS